MKGVLRSAPVWLGALLAGAAAGCGVSDDSGRPASSAPQPPALRTPDLGGFVAVPVSDSEGSLLAQLQNSTDPGLGGQTGDDNGARDPGADSGPPCVDVSSSAWGLNEPTASGVTASESAAFALGERHFSLRWRGAQTGAAAPLPDREVELTLKIEARADQAELVRRAEPSAGASCPDALQLAVSIQISTSDGVLRERADGYLRLQSDRAVLSYSWSAEALSSDVLSGDRAALDGTAATELTLDGVFTRYGGWGFLAAHYGRQHAARIADFPSWNSYWGAGYSGFCFNGVAVLDASQEPSVRDVAAALRDPGALQLVIGPSGVTSQATLSALPVERSACHVPAWNYWSSSPMDLLSVDVELELQASALPAPLHLPARLNGEFPPQGGPLSVSVQLWTWCTSSAHLSPADFVRECGDWGVDLTGYEWVYLDMNDSHFGGGSDFLALVLRGVRACLPGSMSPACKPPLTTEVNDLATFVLFSPKAGEGAPR